ncbi:hypothetical protein Q9L58_008924 [Maublancomyces gigas]|uniref:Uncharacterized protein n=1 Tax=Discina gigas TaxID=1032678 RepID=A0ABR3G8D9_9PEZI
MSTNWRSSTPEAMRAHPLMAAEINWHRETRKLEREIKGLQSEVGLMEKRYHGLQQEVSDMVMRLKAQPPPPVPQQGPPTHEEEGSEGGRRCKKDEDENTKSLPPNTTIYDITEEDLLNLVDEAKAHVRMVVRARAERWEQARMKMMDIERDHSWARREHEIWEDGWREPVEEDMWGLLPAEEHMVAFFRGRNMGEADKRCWLISEGVAGMKRGLVGVKGGTPKRSSAQSVRGLVGTRDGEYSRKTDKVPRRERYS